MSEMNEIPIKRPRGRPRKNKAPGVEREPIKTSIVKMKAKPNWDTLDAYSEDTPDRLYVDPTLLPEGLSAMWVTDSVLGQGVPQHRARFEKAGWTPVHQEDFDGSLDGKFMPKGRQGEINVDGSVLMVRPKEMTLRAQAADKRRAQQQVAIKEAALTGGDIPITLDSQHPTALQSNKIRKSYERVEIPE